MSELPGPEAALPITLTRLRRLALLDLNVLDDVRHDEGATVSSLLVATSSMALLGVGGWLWWVFSGFGDGGAVFLKSVLFGTLASLLMWLVWLLIVHRLLERIAGVTVPVEQLVRAAGFATAPLALGLLMALPAVSFGVGLLALGAWLLTTQAAVERVAGGGSGAVMVANLAGFAAWAVLMSLLTTASNQLGSGPFLAESIWDVISGYEVGRVLLGR